MIPSRVWFRVVLSISLLTASLLGVAQSPDPFVGTWTLNPAKSKYNPGPVPRGQTTIYEAVGKGYNVSIRSERADGTVLEWSYMALFDGKDAPVKGSSPYGDAIASKRIGPNTLEFTHKKAGKPTATQLNVVAADGKSRTVTTTGTDAEGRKVDNTVVFERK